MMKALTLWEPWGTFMALNLKRNETRPRRWNYRGDLAICTAKRSLDRTGLALVQQYNIPICSLSFGKVVCVVFCQGPQPSHLFTEQELTQQEYELGDYDRGRWIYQTGLLRRLETPIPVIGRQGLFNLPPDVEAKVRAQL